MKISVTTSGALSDVLAGGGGAGGITSINALSAAMQRAIGHFPFDREGTLYCDCGWNLDSGGNLDWWAHIEEQGFVVGAPVTAFGA